MIPPQALIDGFDRNVRLLSRRIDGITQAGSLIQPEFEANCLNWTVGHAVEYRNVIMHLLDLPGVGVIGQLDRYQRESEPIRGDGPGVVAIETLMALMEAGQGQIDDRLRTMSTLEWGSKEAVADRVMTVAERLNFLYFHETFHLGQADLLAAMIQG